MSISPAGITVATVMSTSGSIETTTEHPGTMTASVAGHREIRAVKRDIKFSPFTKLRPARTMINVYEAIKNRRAIYQTQRRENTEESANKTVPVTSKCPNI